ncbi:hypothetical protein [Streptomyces corynorhini]|uniref:hypothetical protein n=1 Tax=Streptomyces corynorhini TaxID=2282652 RepID=UPI0018F55B86|nr:hypothetical protein [Streptomyces corynorhini]
MSQQIPSATTQAVDPADFVADLHAEGNMPQNSGGDPAVPDSAFPDTHTYPLPSARRP